MPGMTPELFQKAAARLATIDTLFMSIDAALAAEVDGLKQDVMDSRDTAIVHGMFPQRGDFEGLSGTALSKAYLTRQVYLLTGPIRDCLLTGVVDPTTFLAYYNTGVGGPYRCLVPIAFQVAYTRLTTLSFRPADIAAPPTENMGQRSVGGSLAPGQIVNGTLYAGAVSPVLSVSSSVFTQAKGTGAGIVLVIGKARNKDGDLYDGAQFTARVSSDGESALIASADGDILLSISAITLPPNMSSGTVIVRSQSAAE